MCPHLMSATRILLVAFTTLVWSVDLLRAQTTTRVSVSSEGTQGNGSSGNCGISDDGRLVVFTSRSTNLVAGDTNQDYDVFVHDRVTGETVLASVNSEGEQGNSYSAGGSISGDGRFVAFTSTATNLVSGDTNGYSDVFVHDRQSGDTTRISVDSSGAQANGWCAGGSLSREGRYVAFKTDASNLVDDDNNWNYDVFVHDLVTRRTVRASVDSRGNEGNGPSCFNAPPSLSADGRFVAFESQASNLVPDDTNGMGDIFVHDLQTGETTRVSVSSSGDEANSLSDYPTISADGRVVAFPSEASNLVPGDTNATSDVFTHDRVTGQTVRESVSSSGAEANGASWWYSSRVDISADDRFVVFASFASNLVAGDTNVLTDVFMHDRQAGVTRRVSVSSLGEQADDESFLPAISADGRSIAFGSAAENLVPGDTNRCWDLFVREGAVGPCTFPAVWANYGSGWPGTHGVPDLTATDPVICASATLMAANSAGVDTTGVLFVGLNSAYLPTVWGGTILLRPSLAIPVLVPASGLVLSVPIPCDDSLCALAVFAELVELDPGASRGVSFTPGLQLQLGVD